MTNVLFIIVDELSWWALGHTGGVAVTPNIDALAAQSRRFTAAYTPSPMCVPARAAIAAGVPVSDTGCWSSAEAYHGAPKGWGHVCQEAGVRVESFGKLHYRRAEDPTGFDRETEALHIPGDGVGWVRGLLRKPLTTYPGTEEMAEMIGAGPFDYQDYDRRVTEAACAWLAEPARKTAPWCGFVSLLCPHYPLIAPEEDFALYNPTDFEAEAEPVPDHPVVQAVQGFFDHDIHFTSQTRGIARAGYYGLCTYMDRLVGQVLTTLDKAGLAEDTLVIFTSDHGEMLGEKAMWGKYCMYDSSARVPLLLRGPGINPGQVETPVNLTDLAPTICGTLGLEATFPGDDLRGELDPARDSLSEYHDGGSPVGMTMLRWNEGDHPWKLVHYAEGHPPQLFDLQADPGEEVNLAHSHPEMLAVGMARLHARLDPEATNARAHAAQAARIEALGGRETLEAEPVWNFTPTS